MSAVSGPQWRQNGFAVELHARRGLFLILAAALTAAGVAVPHFDAELISTVLFVAGAGLAGLVVVLPWHSVSRATSSTDPRGQSAFGADGARQLRFPELFGSGAAQLSFDRLAWAKLTAHMSHELRTPLNAVLGFSELMTTEVLGPLGPAYSAYARDIHASGRALLKTTDDALAITALLTAPERSRTVETCKLISVIDEACAFAAPDLSGRSIALAIDAGANFEIAGDHQAIRQMLINLIAEASRSALTGAVLRIEAKGAADTVRLSVALIADVCPTPSDDGFNMILARTLCELSGAELSSGSTGSGEWTWAVRLQRAAQADLFAAAA